MIFKENKFDHRSKEARGALLGAPSTSLRVIRNPECYTALIWKRK